MPSWEIHKVVCEKLLGFYDLEIDKIIDFEISHDSSRYDIKLLAKITSYIEKKYGINGLKQFIMHHYLDRISDIVVHYEVSKRSYPVGKILSPEMMDIDPNNILNVLIHPFEYLEQIAREMYPGKSKRKKRAEVIGRLYRAHQELPKYPELKRLQPLILEVRNLMKSNIEFILKLIHKDERTQKRIEQALKMKQLAPKISAIYHEVKLEYIKKLVEKSRK